MADSPWRWNRLRSVMERKGSMRSWPQVMIDVELFVSRSAEESFCLLKVEVLQTRKSGSASKGSRWRVTQLEAGSRGDRVAIFPPLV